MLMNLIVILAFTFKGEIIYTNNTEYYDESQLIYQTALNRSKICNTTPEIELLKSNQYSCQNSLNNVNFKINKYNTNVIALRLYDAIRVLLRKDRNGKVLYYHSKSMKLSDTKQNKKKMFQFTDKGGHRFYSSTDYSFCKKNFNSPLTNKTINIFPPEVKENVTHKIVSKHKASIPKINKHSHNIINTQNINVEKKDDLEEYRKKLKKFIE